MLCFATSAEESAEQRPSPPLVARPEQQSAPRQTPANHKESSTQEHPATPRTTPQHPAPPPPCLSNPELRGGNGSRPQAPKRNARVRSFTQRPRQEHRCSLRGDCVAPAHAPEGSACSAPQRNHRTQPRCRHHRTQTAPMRVGIMKSQNLLKTVRGWAVTGVVQ